MLAVKHVWGEKDVDSWCRVITVQRLSHRSSCLHHRNSGLCRVVNDTVGKNCVLCTDLDLDSWDVFACTLVDVFPPREDEDDDCSRHLDVVGVRARHHSRSGRVFPVLKVDSQGVHRCAVARGHDHDMSISVFEHHQRVQDGDDNLAADTILPAGHNEHWVCFATASSRRNYPMDHSQRHDGVVGHQQVRQKGHPSSQHRPQVQLLQQLKMAHPSQAVSRWMTFGRYHQPPRPVPHSRHCP